MSTPLERDRRLARLRLERQRVREQTRQRRQRRRRVLTGGLAVLLLALAAGKVATGGGAATPSATPGATTQACAYRSDGTTNPVVTTRPTPPGFATRRNGAATMVTNHGTVVFDLLTSDAPCAVASFAFLAAHKYFDGASCDRLTTGGLQFLQCADSPVKGTGPGYEFPDENLSSTTSYPAGTVGMVNHGPNTNSAAFFLCYGISDLPKQYVPFGRITSGVDVLMAVARGGAEPSGDGAPVLATTILSLRTTGT
jgi:peptidyl-prolyl cis-trans isomerase B (cyclophilin B)